MALKSPNTDNIDGKFSGKYFKLAEGLRTSGQCKQITLNHPKTRFYIPDNKSKKIVVF